MIFDIDGSGELQLFGPISHYPEEMIFFKHDMGSLNIPFLTLVIDIDENLFLDEPND